MLIWPRGFKFPHVRRTAATHRLSLASALCPQEPGSTPCFPLAPESCCHWLHDPLFVCLYLVLFLRTSFLSLPAPHPSPYGGWGFWPLTPARMVVSWLCPTSELRKRHATQPTPRIASYMSGLPNLPLKSPLTWLVLWGRTLDSDTPIFSLILVKVTYMLNQSAFMLS